MKKFDELLELIQERNITTKEVVKADNEKKCNTVLWVLAIIGAVAAVAAIAYAVYRYMTPDYLEDFDDDFDDDFEDDFFDDEDDEEVVSKEDDYTTVK